ncbi:MAG: type II toxin-antitoxin system VapC family toxin [Hyphomicrobiales bacterium]
MSILLDTHSLVWWVTDDPRLSKRARRYIESRADPCFVSAVTAFELATKARLGKLPAAAELADGFEILMNREGFVSLPISVEHGLLAGRMPGTHRDPFDRLLAAQSITEQMPLLTSDPAFGGLGPTTVW